MKAKKILAVIAATIITGAMSASTLAATPLENSDIDTKTSVSDSDVCETNKRPELSDEQKAEMKAKMEAANAKWAALTDAQKKEIYALKDKQAEIENQIIDKYLKYEIIDKTTAEKIKTRIEQSSTKMRESGKLPIFGNKGFRGKKPTLANDATDKAAE